MAHPSVVINGVTYASVPEVDIPKSGGGTAKYYDASQTDAAAGDVLSGKVFVGASGESTGNMANNGGISGEIETKVGTVTIPAGYTSGGTVGLKASAVADLTSANLLSGKTVLGVAGNLTTPTISQDSTTKVLSIS